jgi:hypothetical protein
MGVWLADRSSWLVLASALLACGPSQPDDGSGGKAGTGTTASDSTPGPTSPTSDPVTTGGPLDCGDPPIPCSDTTDGTPLVECGIDWCDATEVCFLPADRCVCDDVTMTCRWKSFELYCGTIPLECATAPSLSTCLADALCRFEDGVVGEGQLEGDRLVCTPRVTKCEDACDQDTCASSPPHDSGSAWLATPSL